MMSAPFHTSPIPPLILRHAQDGAWYWSQLEADRLSPVVSAERLRHYHGLLSCHLEGLRLSGELGWSLAFKELQRWKDPEQLFACWHLAFTEPNPEHSAVLWSFMDTVPEAELATASALVWLPAPEDRTPWLDLWLNGTGTAISPVARRVALRVCGVIGQVPDIPLDTLFEDADPQTVAAACSLAGALRLNACTDRLLYLAARADHPAIREALGEALLVYGQPQAALPLLREAMMWHHTRMEADEGGAALREAHRAQVLACLYGHALPPGALLTEAVPESLPVYLLPHVLAHHGEAAGLSLLSALLETPYAPMALRAICRITGLEAEDEGLCLPAVLPGTPEYAAAVEAEEDSRPGRHLESGLPSPDVSRVRARLFAFSQLPSGVPLLRGLECTPEQCLLLLRTGMMDERFAAAWHAVRLTGCPVVETTAPWTLQEACLHDLQQRSAT